MGPVIAFNLLQSLKIMNNGIDVFTRYAVEEMEANRERCELIMKQSFSVVTALNPHLGLMRRVDFYREGSAQKLDLPCKRLFWNADC